MIEVQIINKHPEEILFIVRDLRSKGYIQGKDFDFYYHHPKFDWFSGDAVYNRHTIFKFENEALATWFSLVYL